jgi:hypothetical protein
MIESDLNRFSNDFSTAYGTAVYVVAAVSPRFLLHLASSIWLTSLSLVLFDSSQVPRRPTNDLQALQLYQVQRVPRFQRHRQSP